MTRRPASAALLSAYGKRRPKRSACQSPTSLFGNGIFLRSLVGFLPRLFDHLGEAAGETARTDRRAAIDAGRSDRFDRSCPVRPGFLLLPCAARAELLGQ